MLGARFVLVALALLPATVLAQQDAPPRTARLAGTVVADDTGLPIEGASVRLFGTTQTGAPTDEQGRFELENVAPGSYFVTGVMAGYALGVAGQRHPAETPTLIELEADSFRHAEIRLMPLGVLSGRIIDLNGRPVQNATVSVVRARSGASCSGCRTTTTSTTDADGQYRLAGLPDGRYYVMASTPGSAGTPGNASTSNRTSAPATPATRPSPQSVSVRGQLQPSAAAITYYPGTALPSQASVVDLAAGRQVDASFTLAESAPARVAGTVTDSRGSPAATHVVFLDAMPPRPRLDSAISEIATDGRFEFTDVPHGEYTLVVRSTSFFTAIMPGGSRRRDDMSELAERRISVPGEGLDALTIRTQRGYEVSGTVIMNGQPLLGAGTMSVSATPAEVPRLLAGGGSSAALAADGTFRMTNIMGRILIGFGPRRDGTMLQRVMAGGIDITDEGIDIVQPTTITIVVGPRSELTGRLTTRRGTPVPGMSVVIFPEDPRRWEAPLDERYVRSVVADTAGRFSVTGLPAGRYHVATVIAQAEGQGAIVPDLALLIPRATPVTLGEGDVRSIDIRVD